MLIENCCEIYQLTACDMFLWKRKLSDYKEDRPFLHSIHTAWLMATKQLRRSGRKKLVVSFHLSSSLNQIFVKKKSDRHSSVHSTSSKKNIHSYWIDDRWQRKMNISTSHSDTSEEGDPIKRSSKDFWIQQRNNFLLYETNLRDPTFRQSETQK